jgi:hypothetical protein
LFNVIEGCYRDPSDDVCGSTSELLKSVEIALVGGKKREGTHREKINGNGLIDPTPKRDRKIGGYLLYVLSGLRFSISTLTELSCRVVSLGIGLSSTCHLLKHILQQESSSQGPIPNSNPNSNSNPNLNPNLNPNPYESILNSLLCGFGEILVGLHSHCKDTKIRCLEVLKPGRVRVVVRIRLWLRIRMNAILD